MKRPRFSLRTLAIVVTLVCAYFGSWEATKRWAIDPEFNDATVPMPFVIQRNRFAENKPYDKSFPRYYYLWLFGWEVKLPFESSWESEAPWEFKAMALSGGVA